MDSVPEITPPPIPSPSALPRFVRFSSRALLVLNELSILSALVMRAFVLPRIVAVADEMGSTLPRVTMLYAAAPLAIHVLVLGAVGAGMIVKEFLIRDTRWRMVINVLCGLLVIVYLVGLIFALFMPILALMEDLSQ